MNLTDSQFIFATSRPRMRWSIRTKLMAAFLSTVVLFGIVNILVVRQLIGDEIKNRFRDQSVRLAIHLSAELEDAILYEDWFAVQNQLWKWKEATSIHGYAMVLGPDGNVLASTFQEGIPAGLLEVNAAPFQNAVTASLFDKEIQYLDIGVPVLSGVAGFLRLGIREPSSDITSDAIVRDLTVMVLGFVILGAIGSFVLGSIISRPLKLITVASCRVDLNEPTPPLFIRTGDEIETLAYNFETMIQRLQDNHRRLTEANRQAYEAENLASIGIISSGVAHEINNPLMGIETGLKRIERNPSNTSQITTYLPHMLQASEHIKGVVQGLLNMSRKESGNRVVVNIMELLQESIEMIRYRIEECGVRVSLKTTSACKPRARVNPQDIIQVILNVLLNALDVSSVGSTVEITLTTSGDSILISIRDEGQGIDSGKIDRIWEPFFTTKLGKQGTGLGLAISKRLVESNDGSIVAKSKVGIGTTMEITLPMAKDHE